MSGLVLACADGRLHDALLALQTRLGLEQADRLLVPGGPAALLRGEHERLSILGWLTMLVPARDVDTIVLVSHEDCLAYAARRVAGIDEHARLDSDLQAARELVSSRLPGATVATYLIPYQTATGRFGSAERRP